MRYAKEDKMKLLVTVVLALMSTQTGAEDIGKGAVPFSAKGVVSSSAQVRDAPPYGPLNLFVGKKVEVLPQGEKVNIVGRKAYGGFDGDHVWYQITSAKRSAQSSWVYGGVEGQTSDVKVEKIIK
jgi:hypothetical protein